MGSGGGARHIWWRWQREKEEVGREGEGGWMRMEGLRVSVRVELPKEGGRDRTKE